MVAISDYPHPSALNPQELVQSLLSDMAVSFKKTIRNFNMNKSY